MRLRHNGIIRRPALVLALRSRKSSLLRAAVDHPPCARFARRLALSHASLRYAPLEGGLALIRLLRAFMEPPARESRVNSRVARESAMPAARELARFEFERR
jgi:hypothetical protein